MKRGKKYLEAEKKVKRGCLFSVSDAVDCIRSMAYAKFDETVEIAVALNIKKNLSVREAFIMPHRFMAERKILVFAKGEKADEALKAGATYVGTDDLARKIEGGWIDFDVCVATPDMMRDVGRLGRFLGRRGLMPNPRTGTVTYDIESVVRGFRSGRMEFCADKGGVVHLAIGKLSMQTLQIVENIKHFASEVFKKRPADLKGDFVKSIYVSSVMGPGIQLDHVVLLAG